MAQRVSLWQMRISLRWCMWTIEQCEQCEQCEQWTPNDWNETLSMDWMEMNAISCSVAALSNSFCLSSLKPEVPLFWEWAQMRLWATGANQAESFHFVQNMVCFLPFLGPVGFHYDWVLLTSILTLQPLPNPLLLLSPSYSYLKDTCGFFRVNVIFPL